MRCCGEPKGKTRVCPRCSDDAYFRYAYPSTGVKNVLHCWETKDKIRYKDCIYCCGLGYKEDVY